MSIVWVRSACIRDMLVEANRMSPKETGGVVLGYHAEGSVVVSAMIGPGPGAKHGRFHFIPDHDYHVKEVARIYRESKRTITYLGDWHSHPWGGGSPSWRDEKTLERIASFPAARIDRPVMLIVSGGLPWRLSVWQWSPDSRGGDDEVLKVVPLEIRHF